MSHDLVKKNLSEKEFLDAISYEFYLNNKRVENEKFEAKFNFGSCRICDDEATGIHYGASSCEGCKGFFKRSIIRHKKYVCRGNKNCKILPKERKKCKYCRWSACVKAGMSLDCVRMGRIPNSMKQIKLKNISNIIHNVSPHSNRKENFCLSLKYLIKINNLDRYKQIDTQNIVPKTYFTQNCLHNSQENQIIVLSLLRDKSFQLYRECTQEFESQEKRALKLIESGYTRNKYDYSQEFVQSLRLKDLKVLKNHAISMMNLIRELPGFQKVNHHDINAILNEQFFTILGIRTFKLFIDDDYFHMLDEHTQMNRDVFGFLMGEMCRDKVFEFYFNLKKFQLTDQELGLLIPFFLTVFTDQVQDQELFKELNEYYGRALYYEFSLNKRNQEFIQSFAQAVSWAPNMNKMCQDIDFNLEINDLHL